MRLFGQRDHIEQRIDDLAGRMDALARNQATLFQRVEELVKRFDGAAPAVLRADLDDLRAACDIDRAALRKQLGKLWARIGRDERADAPSSRDDVEDAELRAWLDLQKQTT